MADHARTPAHATIARVAARHATIAAPHHLAGNCADCLTERAPCDARAVAAIAEAGLRLRDALDAGNGHRRNCSLPVADCPWCSAAAAFDAAVRAACGEGV